MGAWLRAWPGAIAVGISLSLFGSGGSIITAPVLVYLMGRDEKLATAGSLFVVGNFALKSYSGFSQYIVMRDTEITRDMPDGHTNAVFLTDASALYNVAARAMSIDDAEEVVEMKVGQRHRSDRTGEFALPATNAAFGIDEYDFHERPARIVM